MTVCRPQVFIWRVSWDDKAEFPVPEVSCVLELAAGYIKNSRVKEQPDFMKMIQEACLTWDGKQDANVRTEKDKKRIPSLSDLDLWGSRNSIRGVQDSLKRQLASAQPDIEPEQKKHRGSTRLAAGTEAIGLFSPARNEDDGNAKSVMAIKFASAPAEEIQAIADWCNRLELMETKGGQKGYMPLNLKFEQDQPKEGKSQKGLGSLTYKKRVADEKKEFLELKKRVPKLEAQLKAAERKVGSGTTADVTKLEAKLKAKTEELEYKIYESRELEKEKAALAEELAVEKAAHELSKEKGRGHVTNIQNLNMMITREKELSVSLMEMLGHKPARPADMSSSLTNTPGQSAHGMGTTGQRLSTNSYPHNAAMPADPLLRPGFAPAQ